MRFKSVKKNKLDTRQRPAYEPPTRRPGSMGEARRDGGNWLRAFWATPAHINRATQALCGAAFLLLAFMGGVWAMRLPMLEFRQVQVVGDVRHLQRAELARLVRQWRGNFLTLDLERVRRDVAALAWVKDADVARRWPAELIIAVNEHQPLARWGRRSLVDNDGKVFAGEVDGSFPRLFGPDEHAERVVEHYHKLVLALAPIGARPSEVRLSPRLAWEVQLDNGFKLELGRADFDERLQTFLTAYRVELHNFASNTLVVDLRYKRGLALKVGQLQERPGDQPAGASSKSKKTGSAKKRTRL